MLTLGCARLPPASRRLRPLPPLYPAEVGAARGLNLNPYDGPVEHRSRSSVTRRGPEGDRAADRHQHCRREMVFSICLTSLPSSKRICVASGSWRVSRRPRPKASTPSSTLRDEGARMGATAIAKALSIHRASVYRLVTGRRLLTQTLMSSRRPAIGASPISHQFWRSERAFP
jgi:hypothetical protein